MNGDLIVEVLYIHINEFFRNSLNVIGWSLLESVFAFSSYRNVLFFI